MQKPSIDKKTARVIKEMLWKGRKQSIIHAITKASQASISRIKTGETHADVPWPNGEVGGIPSSASDPISEVDWSADAKRFLTFPEEMQARILLVVNKRRVESSQVEIPAIAPSYKTYLEADESDRVWEAAALEDARKSEDSRLSILMTEFDELVEEENAVRKDEDTRQIFSQTRRTRSVEDDAPRPKSTDLKYDKMTIEEILSMDPRNILALEALAMDNPFLTEATCIIFYQNHLQVGGWKGDAVRRSIYTLMDKLGEYPDVVRRLKGA